MRARGLLPLLFLALGCSASDKAAPAVSVTAAPAADAACARAGEARRMAATARAEGRLDRARRALVHAEALCPGEAALGWADLLAIDAELGARAEGLALAGLVEGRADAPKAAKEAAAALRRAFEGPAPSGDELVAKGLAALGEGKRVEAQRLLDRGRIALEAAAGAPMAIGVKGELGGVIGATTWSRDGKALAVAHGRFITVLPVDPGRPSVRFAGHTTPVGPVQWLHDGARIVSASADGAILLWNTASGAVERRFTIGTDTAEIAVSPDDRRVAVAGNTESKLRVLDLRDGKKVLEVEAQSVGMLGFVPGKDEVWARAAFAIAWWDLGSGKQVHEVGVGDNAASVSPSGRDVAISGSQHELVLHADYGKKSRGPLATAPGCEAHLFPGSFTPDGKTLLVERMDHQAMALALPGGKARWTRKDIAEMHAFSDDATLLAEGSADGKVTVRDAASGAVRIAMAAGGELRRLVFSPDGKHLAGVVGNGGVRIWDFERPVPVRAVGAERDEVRALGAGDRRLTVVRKGMLYSLASGKAWSTRVSAERAVVSRDGASAIAVGEKAELWDVEGQRARGTLPADGIHELLPSATEVSYFVNPANTFTLRGAQGAAERAFPALWHRSAFTADGRQVVAVMEGKGGVGIWETATGALKCAPGAAPEQGAPWPEKIATTRDGSRFVAMVKNEMRVYRGCDPTPRVVPTGWSGAPPGELGITDDGRFVVYRKDTESKLFLWPVEGGPVVELAVPERGHLSLGPAGEIVVWGARGVAFAAPGREVVTLPISGATAAAWAREGGRLLLGFEDGTLQVLDARKHESVAELRPIGPGPATVAIASGLFEVLGEAGGALQCEIGGRALPIDVCRERLEVQGLVERVLRGDRSYLDP